MQLFRKIKKFFMPLNSVECHEISKLIKQSNLLHYYYPHKTNKKTVTDICKNYYLNFRHLSDNEILNIIKYAFADFLKYEKSKVIYDLSKTTSTNIERIADHKLINHIDYYLNNLNKISCELKYCGGKYMVYLNREYLPDSNMFPSYLSVGDTPRLALIDCLLRYHKI